MNKQSKLLLQKLKNEIIQELPNKLYKEHVINDKISYFTEYSLRIDFYDELIHYLVGINDIEISYESKNKKELYTAYNHFPQSLIKTVLTDLFLYDYIQSI